MQKNQVEFGSNPAWAVCREYVQKRRARGAQRPLCLLSCSVFSSHCLQGKPREIRGTRIPLYRVRNGKKDNGCFPTVPRCLGHWLQHYCKFEISEVPPPSLSRPSLITTKVFVMVLGMVASIRRMLRCISQP